MRLRDEELGAGSLRLRFVLCWPVPGRASLQNYESVNQNALTTRGLRNLRSFGALAAASDRVAAVP